MTVLEGPDFARIRCSLLREGEPDRVPLYDGVSKGVMSSRLGKPVNDLKSTVEFRVKAGYDYVSLGEDLWRTLQSGKGGAPRGQSKKGQYSLYTNVPEGRVWAKEGKGVITSMKDFEEFSWPVVSEMDFSPFDKVAEYMPEGMKTISAVGHIFTTVWTLMGLETFFIALSQDPSLVSQMFQKVESIQNEVLDKVIRYGCVGAVVIGDDIAFTPGLMISPKHLRKYLFPTFERMCAVCHQRKIPVIYHSDGKLDDVLEDLIAVGFDALHPIQPNAMDIRKVKERAGQRLCLLGNIDLDVLARGTTQEVEELVKRNLREIAPGGGYCVGSSNSVADFVKVENYNSMRETTLRHGKYPIVV